MDWTGLHRGLDWKGKEWIRLDLTGLDWIGLGCVELDWTGLDWIGFDLI